MKKLIAIAGAIIPLFALISACGKKTSVDPAAVNAALVAVNDELPMQLGVDLKLVKASMVDDKIVRFDYESPYPSRVRMQPRATGLMRGAMMQFACGDASARQILDAGFTIDHRVTDAEGHEMFATQADVSVCSVYDK